jgi:hypothetical protein
MPIEAPPWPGAVRPSLGPAGPARGAETVAAVAGRARRPGPGAGRALYRGRRLRQEAGGGEGGATQLPGEGGGSAPGGHGAQPAAALTLACAPPAFWTQPGPRLHISSPAPLRPVSPETLPPQTSGKTFPTSDRAGGARRPQPPSLAPSSSSGPPISAAWWQWGPTPNLKPPCPPASTPAPVPRLARRASPARYLRRPPSPASLPEAVAAPSLRPTRPAARRRAVPGQRPCQPRPPAPLAFPSPPQPMCGQSRPRAADPAVNPAPSSGPAVPSPLGKTLRAPNASRDPGAHA